MFFVGIDIGKNNHVASMIDDTGKVVFKAFSFPNTSDGENALFSKLASYSLNPSDFEIGMEATGHYWLSVYSLRKVSFSMPSPPSRPTSGAGEQKSANSSWSTSPSSPIFLAKPQKKSFFSFLFRFILNRFHLKPWRNCLQSSAGRKSALRKRNS